MSNDRSQSYFHYFDFGLGGYIDRLLLRVRRSSFEVFMHAFSPAEGDETLDVGVSADDHVSSNYFIKHYPHTHRVTALSIDDFEELEEQYPGLTFVRGDGRDLPFPDKAFDYVHSHAVVEHVGSRQRQIDFVRELARVSRKGFMFTTPNRWHPMETHTGLPLLHYTPAAVYRPIYRVLGKKMYASEELLNLLSGRTLRSIVAASELDGWETSYAAVRWLGLPSNLLVLMHRSE